MDLFFFSLYLGSGNGRWAKNTVVKYGVEQTTGTGAFSLLKLLSCYLNK